MGTNCVASASIGLLLCFKGCNAERLRNDFVFVPPAPSTYSTGQDAKDKSKEKLVYAMKRLQNSQIYQAAALAGEIRWVTTKRGSRIPIVWFKQAVRPEGQPLVLLHCHANATDIGMMMAPYFELAKGLGVEVVGVEYSGYGPSGDKPNSGKTIADVEAAYDYVVSCGVPADRIVAYGQSIGTGPVADLMSKKKLGGLILHSPILSAIKVVDPQPDQCCRPSCMFECFDFYPNDRLLKQATCPVLIMHGQQDKVVPFYHAKRLFEICPKEKRWPPYFPLRANHNNIPETDMKAYFGELQNFLNDVKRRAAGMTGGGLKNSFMSCLSYTGVFGLQSRLFQNLTGREDVSAREAVL